MLKRLAILLKWKEKKKYYSFGLICLLVLFCPVICVQSEESKPIEVIVGSDEDIYSTDEQVNCEIQFRDTTFYNEGLYLSYHLLNAETEEQVQYENERVMVPKPNSSGFSNVVIDIVIPDSLKNKKLIICLDIVDTLNGYWLSDDDYVFPSLIYEYNLRRMIMQKLQNEASEGGVVLGINVGVSIISVVSVLQYKKKIKRYSTNQK